MQKCTLGVLPKSSGSAYVEHGNTKVVAAVYGPHEVTTQKSLHDRAVIRASFQMAPFSSIERKRRSKTDRRHVEMATAIQQALEVVVETHLYPRCQIDIVLEVLQSDGGAMHTCLNAAILAVIDAGIPVTDYICACSAGIVQETPLLDLNEVEERSQMDLPKFTIAVLPRSGKTTLLHLESRMHMEKFEAVVDIAVQGARQIHAILHQAVRQKLEAQQ